MKNEMILKVKDVSKSYKGETAEHPVFKDLNFEVSRSESVCFLGPSGCGKSTLLACIAGLTDHQGNISINGGSPSVSIREKKLAVAFQQSGLIPWKTVWENILLPAAIGKNKEVSPDIREHGEKLLEIIGLSAYRGFYPSALSGGMRQRVALARALLLKPEVLLLDEPFSSVDDITRLRLIIEFKEILSEFKTTTVLITHNMEEAAFFADRIFILGSAPTGIVSEIDVCYGVPRDKALIHQPGFINVVNLCREKIFSYV